MVAHVPVGLGDVFQLLCPVLPGRTVSAAKCHHKAHHLVDAIQAVVPFHRCNVEIQGAVLWRDMESLEPTHNVCSCWCVSKRCRHSRMI